MFTSGLSSDLAASQRGWIWLRFLAGTACGSRFGETACDLSPSKHNNQANLDFENVIHRIIVLWGSLRPLSSCQLPLLLSYSHFCPSFLFSVHERNFLLLSSSWSFIIGTCMSSSSSSSAPQHLLWAIPPFSCHVSAPQVHLVGFEPLLVSRPINLVHLSLEADWLKKEASLENHTQIQEHPNRKTEEKKNHKTKSIQAFSSIPTSNSSCTMTMIRNEPSSATVGRTLTFQMTWLGSHGSCQALGRQMQVFPSNARK